MKHVARRRSMAGVAIEAWKDKRGNDGDKLKSIVW